MVEKIFMLFFPLNHPVCKYSLNKLSAYYVTGTVLGIENYSSKTKLKFKNAALTYGTYSLV